MIRRLLLIRHAKSSHKYPHLNDHDRPLNKRGERDKIIMSKYLQDREENLQSIYSSTATRSITLAKTIAKQLEIPLKTHAPLYTFSSRVLMDGITQLPDHLERLAIVAHNPAITDLVNRLSDEYIVNIPTSGIVALNCDADAWSEIRSVEVDYFVYPKMFV